MKGNIMSVQENKVTLQRAAEQFNNPQQRSAWFAIHDPSVVAMGLGPKPLDLDGLKKFYDGLWNAFPDLRITIEDIIGEDDTVAWRLSVTGTHKAEFRGVAPTGKRVAFTAQYVFRFRNGKIVERWTNLDRLGVLIQLGAVPAPPV